MIIAGLRLLAAVLLTSALVSEHLRADEPKKDDAAAKKDEQAKELAVRFMKAYKDKDIDGMMKMVDAPFYHEPGEPVVIKERDVLRDYFSKQLNRLKEPDRLPTHAVRLMTYGNERKKLKDFDEKLLKVQDEVFAIDDRIVIIGEPKSDRELIVGVRFRDGKALVCAFFK
jgi:hypothetical protein